MELQYLPTDALIHAMRPLSAQEILRLCRTNAGINVKCKSEEFIRGILGLKYKLYKLDTIPGGTLQEKYNYVMKLINDAETLETYDMALYDDLVNKARLLVSDKFMPSFYNIIFLRWKHMFGLNMKYVQGKTKEERYQYIINLIKDSKTKDIFTMVPYIHTGELISRDFRHLLSQAAHVRSKTFLETIIYNLLTRIDINSRYLYLPSFGSAFMTALYDGNPEIINVLLQYYVPKEQLGFDILVRNYIVENGALEAFKRMLPYIDVTYNDFSVALDHDHYELADFIRAQLIIKEGDDPLSDQAVVDELYIDAMLDDDKHTIKYLMDRGARFDQDSDYFVNNRTFASPEMIQYLREIGLLK